VLLWEKRLGAGTSSNWATVGAALRIAGFDSRHPAFRRLGLKVFGIPFDENVNTELAKAVSQFSGGIPSSQRSDPRALDQTRCLVAAVGPNIHELTQRYEPTCIGIVFEALRFAQAGDGVVLDELRSGRWTCGSGCFESFAAFLQAPEKTPAALLTLISGWDGLDFGANVDHFVWVVEKVVSDPIQLCTVAFSNERLAPFPGHIIQRLGFYFLRALKGDLRQTGKIVYRDPSDPEISWGHIQFFYFCASFTEEIV